MKRIYFLISIIATIYFNCNAQSDTIQVLPMNPTINDSIIVIINKCSFDLTSYKIENDTIFIKVTTDGRIMAPCVLTNDSVNIGKLNQGEWTLQYSYIDKALSTPDSIIYFKTINFQVNGVTKISTVRADEKWKIYPNPTNEFIFIEKDKSNFLNDNVLYLTIINLDGKVLYKKTLNYNKSMINISDLNNGLYIISIMDGNKVINKLIQKNNN